MALATPKSSLFSKSYRSVAFFGGKVYAKWVNLLDKKGGGGKIGYQKILKKLSTQKIIRKFFDTLF